MDFPEADIEKSSEEEKPGVQVPAGLLTLYLMILSLTESRSCARGDLRWILFRIYGDGETR